MKKCSYQTEKGAIVYWTNDQLPGRPSLIFLPGLTADHRLFDKQIEYFMDKANILVWDAPGHAASRPFELTFSLADKARWLHEILAKEGITAPILVGQSMGGYVSQQYFELYPGEPAGFVCIDSAPLIRSYMTGIELWMLKHVEPIYRMYPWKALLRDGSRGCATTEYGRQLMYDMMDVYSTEKEYYCHLTGHGFRILAQAVEADLPYRITSPVILVCGEKDQAGSAKGYNKKWTRISGHPLRWLPDAGHNANTDQPEMVNSIIEEMIEICSPS